MSTAKKPFVYKVPESTRKEILREASKLLEQECYNKKECDTLALKLQELQFRCNDAWADYYADELDEKGNLPSHTMCYDLRQKKNGLQERYKNHGGKRTKSKRLGKKRRRTKRR